MGQRHNGVMILWGRDTVGWWCYGAETLLGSVIGQRHNGVVILWGRDNGVAMLWGRDTMEW